MNTNDKTRIKVNKTNEDHKSDKLSISSISIKMENEK